jgi:hypothetical protein
MSKRIAIYTSIFGNYDNLIDDQLQIPNVDYICFSPEKIQSSTWNVIKSTPIYEDPNRCAKKFKILPHRFLKNYEYSIWIDGNIKVIGDINDIIYEHPYQVYDHMNLYDARNCIYKESNAIIEMGINNFKINPSRGVLAFKDDPAIIEKQMKLYMSNGYPSNNGLVANPIIFRNHKNTEVINIMEHWWNEIKYHSKRDQLSFNYVAWKYNFKYNLLEGDCRNNKYFLQTGKHTGKK